MPARIKRAEAKKQIRAAIMSLLEAEKVEAGRLEDIKTIIEGEKLRVSKEFPLLAVIRESERVAQQRLHISCEYELALLAIVADDDPTVGMDKAEWLADEAVAIVLASRNLGLGFVNDVRLVRSIPVSAPHTERRKIGSIGIIQITYTIISE